MLRFLAMVSSAATRGTERTGGHRAVARALDILERLSARPAGASLTELAQALGAPKTSLLPLLRTLVGRGYATRGESGRYAAGPRWLAAGERGVAAPPDLVVSDVMMPKVNGLELLRRLRADVRTKAIPVILVSARAGEEARIEGATSGADDYVVKPFSARELVARVTAQLELSRLRTAADSQRRTLYQLFSEAPAAIAILRGPEHVFELANPMYCELVGRKPEELLGRAGREALPELIEQGTWEIFDRIRDNGETFKASAFPTRLNGQGRDRGYLNWVARPVRGEDGQAGRILVFAVDVTDQVIARERAEELTKDLERASRAKDEFVAMLGHELRNPLAPISTALRVMELRGISGGEREPYLTSQVACCCFGSRGLAR